MNTQDQIVEFLKVIGPTLPAKVAKNIKSEIIIASAHLSDLAGQGLVKISSLKVGGSPLYYLPGQEAQIYPFAAGNINPKDLQVLERLKEEKVLQEASLDLLSKVALRSLRDFAVPLHVYIDGKRQLFWKWHLLPLEETNTAIANVLRRNELFSTPKAAETVAVNAPSPVQKEREKGSDSMTESAATTGDLTPVSLVQEAVFSEKVSTLKDEIQQKLPSKRHEKKEIKKAAPVEEKSSEIKKAGE
ncbi:MAG: hypothetical protein Q8R37_06015, partial [Nanoarchaeota archaeon]|nr:hypothetical protein [Nanoarchaeota archaeon]